MGICPNPVFPRFFPSNIARYRCKKSQPSQPHLLAHHLAPPHHSLRRSLNLGRLHGIWRYGEVKYSQTGTKQNGRIMGKIVVHSILNGGASPVGKEWQLLICWRQTVWIAMTELKFTVMSEQSVASEVGVHLGYMGMIVDISVGRWGINQIQPGAPLHGFPTNHHWDYMKKYGHIMWSRQSWFKYQTVWV